MNEVNFLEELKKIKQPVWQTIEQYLPHQEPHIHYNMVAEYPRRQGKYLRPGLLLLANEMFGGQMQNAILTAASMQISEDWLLIHDDFEDHSEERRSTAQEYRPTLNKIYGDEIAVNAGDSLHIIMWKILGDAVKNLEPEKGWKVYNKMSQILLTTTEGQYLELNWIKNNYINVDFKNYYEMIYHKTCWYTIIGPLQLGAIIGGAKNYDIKNIQTWGTPLGYAFQIWDDVMNLTVDSDIQGKEKAGDIWEGKRTLPLIHLLKICCPIERDYINTIYAKPREQKTKQEINCILNLMKNYGCIEYAKKTATDYIKEAKKLFYRYTLHLPETHAKKVIKAGIEFLANRDR